MIKLKQKECIFLFNIARSDVKMAGKMVEIVDNGQN